MSVEEGREESGVVVCVSVKDDRDGEFTGVWLLSLSSIEAVLVFGCEVFVTRFVLLCDVSGADEGFELRRL